MIRTLRLAGVALGALALAPTSALAWGSMGHRIIGMAAVEALPAETPAFLRTPTAAADIGELSRELDLIKGAGKTLDANNSPAHFVDVEDDGRILGGPTLATLPATRAEYEAALDAAGSDGWKAGFLPYSIVETWQRLAKDFGYWRALYAAEARETDLDRRAWYAEFRRRRETLILSTIGDLSHYVGDGSQPLHVTVHYNGWGDYPNPKGYTRARIHEPFEAALVFDNVKPAAVVAAMTPFQPCDCEIDKRTADYLTATSAQIEPLYILEKAGGMKPGDPRGPAFATARMAAGASELRDQIVEAWRAGGNAKVGYPAVSVSDIESGKVDPYAALFGV